MDVIGSVTRREAEGLSYATYLRSVRKNVKSAMRKSRGRGNTVRVTDTRVFVDVSGRGVAVSYT